MPQTVVKYLLLLALALVPPVSLAEGAAPDLLLRAAADDVIGKIKFDRELQALVPARAEVLVEGSLVPLFDFSHMTKLAVARNWNLATPAQQSTITEEFKKLLVRTYSTALARYQGETVDFKQLRTAPQSNNVTVRSELKQPGNQKTTLDYEMERTPAGWKIYNVKIADVCLVSTYRDIFAEKVREGGVDGLIQFLAQENRGGASRFNAIETDFWEKSRLVYAIFQKVLRSGLQ